MQPIVRHVAPLTEGTKIGQPVVGRIAVQVCRCEHDPRDPEPRCFYQVRPSRHSPAAISPRCRLLIEPASVWQAADEDQVGPAATLASSSCAIEADMVAQLAPVWRIERPQLAADWHAMPSPSFPAGDRRWPDRPQPVRNLGWPELLVPKLVGGCRIDSVLPTCVDAGWLRSRNSVRLRSLRRLFSNAANTPACRGRPCPPQYRY